MSSIDFKSWISPALPSKTNAVDFWRRAAIHSNDPTLGLKKEQRKLILELKRENN